MTKITFFRLPRSVRRSLPCYPLDAISSERFNPSSLRLSSDLDRHRRLPPEETEGVKTALTQNELFPLQDPALGETRLLLTKIL